MKRFVIIPLAIFVLAFAASAWLRVDDLTLVLAVIWPAAGIVAGVLVGAVAFIVQSIPSVQRKVILAFRVTQSAVGQDLDTKQESEIREKFALSVAEIRQNVLVVLLCLGMLAACTWWAYTDLPYVSWPWWMPLSKLQSIHAIALFTFAAVLWAAWDTLESMFLVCSLESESDAGLPNQKKSDNWETGGDPGENQNNPERHEDSL